MTSHKRKLWENVLPCSVIPRFFRCCWRPWSVYYGGANECGSHWKIFGSLSISPLHQHDDIHRRQTGEHIFANDVIKHESDSVSWAMKISWKGKSFPFVQCGKLFAAARRFCFSRQINGSTRTTLIARCNPITWKSWRALESRRKKSSPENNRLDLVSYRTSHEFIIFSGCELEDQVSPSIMLKFQSSIENWPQHERK